MCVMFHQYRESKGILLQPAIQFRNLTSHYTRTQPHFANISRCRLSQTQQFFRHTATSQWNSLPSDIKQNTCFTGFCRATRDFLLCNSLCCLIYLVIFVSCCISYWLLCCYILLLYVVLYVVSYCVFYVVVCGCMYEFSSPKEERLCRLLGG